MDAFDPRRLAQVGASRMDVIGYRNQAPGFDPRSGEGARRFGGQAIRTPSATGTGDVFAVLLDHVTGPALHIALLETWSVLADLHHR